VSLQQELRDTAIVLVSALRSRPIRDVCSHHTTLAPLAGNGGGGYWLLAPGGFGIVGLAVGVNGHENHWCFEILRIDSPAFVGLRCSQGWQALCSSFC
jgi:hypothetical protein